MKIEKLNPFIRYASMHQTYRPQRESSIAYDCRLFYVLEGEGKFLVNGQNFTVSKNFCAFLPPETHYSFSFSEDKNVKIYVLNFDLVDEFCEVEKSLGTATEGNFCPEKVLRYALPEEFCQPIIQPSGAAAFPWIAECVDLTLQKIAYYKHSASAHLKLALIELLREANNDKSDYKLISAVQTYVRENYSNAELDNQAIARHFGYHPYHVNRLMKLHAKQTLHGYLMDYRLRMAKNYLRTTALNVTEVAEKTGFASYTYFIKLFRERVGISPLQYKRTHSNVGF